MTLIHPIDPVYDKDSRILILGSFPSVKSRESGFFYGHPQNRFWKILAAVFQESVPDTIQAKKDFLLRNHVAVWDVIRSCDISGSADTSIRNASVNDLSIILNEAKIERICANGTTAEKLYRSHLEKQTGRQIVLLPSSSPANAAYSLERLIRSWSAALFDDSAKP